MYKRLQELVSTYVDTYGEAREQLREEVVTEIDRLIEATRVIEDDAYIVHTRELRPRVVRFYFIRRLLELGYRNTNRHKGTFKKMNDGVTTQ